MRYHFSNYLLDTKARRLTCHGELIALEPLAFNVLRDLCEHAGEILSIEQLLDKHWPGVVVTPNSLSRVVAQIRKALQDSHRDPKYIETVPKAGYRFVASVRVDRSLTQREEYSGIFGSKMQRRVLIGVVCLMLVSAVFLMITERQQVPEPISLAVFNASEHDSIVASSVAQEVVEYFYRTGTFKVRGYLASEQALENHTDYLTAAESLGATHFVTHSFRPRDSAETVWNSYAELISTETGHVLWSQRRELPVSALSTWPHSLGSELSNQLLGLPIAVAARGSIHQPHPQAYRLYLNAKYVWLRRGSMPMSDAIYMLREAVSIDPDFAAAWDLLAASLNSWKYFDRVPEGTAAEAMAAAQKAIELDPSVSLSHYIFAEQALSEREYYRAIQLARQSLDNAPNNAMAAYWYGFMLRSIGHMEESLTIIRHATEIDPTIQVIQADYAIGLVYGVDQALGYRCLVDLWSKGMRATFVAKYLGLAKLQLEGPDAAEQWLSENAAYLLNDLNMKLRLQFERGEPISSEQLREHVETTLANGADDRSLLELLQAIEEYDLLFEFIHRKADHGELATTYVLVSFPDDVVNDPRMINYFERVGLLDYWRDYAIEDVCVVAGERVRCRQSRVSLNKLIGQ